MNLNLFDIDLAQLESALQWLALVCAVLIFSTLISCVQTVWQLRQEVRRRFRKTETEKRIGRERL